MKTGSEQRDLILLKKNGPTGAFDIYKAAISQANLGASIPEERDLPENQKALLEVRRHLASGSFEKIPKILQSLNADHPLLEGDREFLHAQYYHRTGEQGKAAEFMIAAALHYAKAGESYRELRALSNAHICLSTLESCLFGELVSLEQEARREGFLDLAANIVRTRAMELLIAGRLSEAYVHAMDAAELYQLEGYPDDRAVAIMVGAIALFMNGEVDRAKETRARCLHSGAKLKSYIGIYEDLVQGKSPKVKPGHPLDRVKWTKNSLKSNSIPGKIIHSLKERPMTRDELIVSVWGESASDVSYCSRLYTAINYIKKSKGIDVAFDGERYKLA